MVVGNMKSGKRKYKLILRRVLVPVLVVLGLVLMPAHLSATDTAVLAGISPLAVPIRNLWGAPKSEAVDAVLYRTDSAVGWSWSRENPQKQPGVTYIQPIYPSARITLKAPVSVGDIQSFNLFAGYQFTQKPTGKYNLAFDIFLREKGTAKDNRKAEIMVWLGGNIEQPILSYKGVRSDGHYIYKDYSWTKSNGFEYYSFLLDSPDSLISQPVNLKALMDLIKPDKDWFITEVELGTEVWNGTGAIELNTFYVEINGEKL
jgi:hypothetical protein